MRFAYSMFYVFCLLAWFMPVFGNNSMVNLKDILSEGSPFEYPLNPTLSISSSDSADLTVLVHGFGGDHKIIDMVRKQLFDKNHLLSFNLPDYWVCDNSYDVYKTTFGSIEELLPLIYVLKKCVVDGGVDKINLYGFSAGGGVVVNTLGVLNKGLFDSEISAVGITKEDVNLVLSAVQSGRVILDCPLKTMQEIIDLRGYDENLGVMAKRYASNDLIPMDSLKKLSGLKLNAIVHFQTKDEIIFNRDDMQFIDQLTTVNSNGTTMIIFGDDGGHNTVHSTLWDVYSNL